MSRRYDPTTNVGQNWRVTLQGPLDIRTVMGTTSDLLSKAAFGGVGQQDLRYQGMLVTVVEDTPVNNGVYYLKDDPDEVTITESSWVKLIGLPDDSGVGEGDDYVLEYKNGNFVWERKTIPQSLSDLSDVSIDSASSGDYLRYNSITGKWENSSGGGGSGSGVTTEDIYYGNLFKDPSLGGLGYVERGVSGTGFGFLRKNEPWDKGNVGESTIPAGTTYQEIFSRIFDGENISLTVNSPQNRTYNSSYQLFGDLNVQLSAPAGYSLYYRVGNSGSWTSYDSSLLKGKDAGTYTWQIRINQDDSTIKTAVLNISKANLTITSGSAEKVFDGTPLTRHTCTFSPNYNDHGLTVNYTGTGTLPGSYQNTFTTSGTLSSNYNSNVIKTPGTLKITPLVRYTISSGSITPSLTDVSINTSISDSSSPAYNKKISGVNDAFYVCGKSGPDNRFRVYVYANKTISTIDRWYWNATTSSWSKITNEAKGFWENITESTQTDTFNGTSYTTYVYTFSELYPGTTTEKAYDFVNIAFRVS